MQASPRGHGAREPHHGRPCAGRRGALKLLIYVPPAILTFSVAAQAASPPPPPGGPEPLFDDGFPLFDESEKKR